MFAAILVAALVCPKPRVIDTVAAPWTDFDTQSFERAQKRCKEKYPNSPCLKRFERTAPLTYIAICGRPE